MNISTKIFTLDEQIEFINKTRQHLDKNPESEIQLGADPKTIDLLRAIEMNLITTKAWVTLPHHHQAGMHVLDEAFKLEKRVKSLTSPAQFLAFILDEVASVPVNDDADYAEVILEQIAAVGLLGVSKFLVPLRQVKEVNNG